MTSAAAATRAVKPARKRAYNPGEPRGIRRTGETTYDVESFLRDGVIHEGVDLADRSCSCEHYHYRILPARRVSEAMDDCKHIEFALQYATTLAWVGAHTMIEPRDPKPAEKIDTEPVIQAVADPDPRDYDPFAIDEPTPADEPVTVPIVLTIAMPDRPIRTARTDPDYLRDVRHLSAAA